MERHDGVNANKLIGGTKNEELKDTLDDIVKHLARPGQGSALARLY